jgi:hypothetical protein
MQLEDQEIDQENWVGKIAQIGVRIPVPGMSSAFPSLPLKSTSGRAVGNRSANFWLMAFVKREAEVFLPLCALAEALIEGQISPKMPPADAAAHGHVPGLKPATAPSPHASSPSRSAEYNKPCYVVGPVEPEMHQFAG